MPYGVVPPQSSVSFIDTLPADKHALHDIRFRFRVDNIWTVISTNNPELRPNEVSKDISLESIVTHDLTIKTTIHHTENSDSGTSIIENIEEYTREEVKRDPGLLTDAPHVSQVSRLSNDKFDKATKEDEGVRATR